MRTFLLLRAANLELLGRTLIMKSEKARQAGGLWNTGDSMALLRTPPQNRNLGRFILFFA